jgi:hypothetical protein
LKRGSNAAGIGKKAIKMIEWKIVAHEISNRRHGHSTRRESKKGE